MIETSKSLQKILRTLESHDAVDWVPVDVAAKSVIDLTVGRFENDPAEDHSFDRFNIVNPQTVQWNDLVEAVSEFYHKQGCLLEVVEYGDWLNALRQIDLSSEQVDRYPGLKLTEFYEDMGRVENRKVQLATNRSVQVVSSSSLAKLQPINSQLVEKWLKGWAF